MKNKALNTQLVMTLKNGRKLGYAEYGDCAGKPLFFFHGLPGSRLEGRQLNAVARLHHYRLISPDRPGMGWSDMDERRTILSWASDIEALANHLSIEKFSIIAHSGGAPFAAACAYKIPERVHSMAIVAGMAPLEIPEATASLARGHRFLCRTMITMPWVASCMMKLTRMMYKRPSMLNYVLKQLPIVDQAAFHLLGNNEEQAATLMETFRQGTAGASQEMVLTVRPWGFPLENIKCPVTVWQGGLDKQAPLAHAEIYATRISNAKLFFFKDEGHISLLVNQAEAILQHISPG